jgi:hypothetical protein
MADEDFRFLFDTRFGLRQGDADFSLNSSRELLGLPINSAVTHQPLTAGQIFYDYGGID